eukprot:1714629-Pleurochrysis_carterae.AAC.1
MFTAVAKLHFVSASACLAIAFIHTYWIHGSHALGLAERPNPMLVTHVSHLDLNPTFDCAVSTVKLISMSAPEIILKTVCFADKMDEQFNDAVIDFAIAMPSMLGARIRQTFRPAHVCAATTAAPCQRPLRSASVSVPIATCSHALIASSARRNAPR